ncbi:MAG: 4'-phosphopantetheinyl transferase superfamily protein [Bacteroidales bacterium]|jgi:phosphopantetheinyl transferase|nr:4'-phosphopantetheinyl transferase superfamily protein [Bacteroidales bacterium]
MGLFLKKKLKDEADISIWEITESEDELLNGTSVPNNELEEIEIAKSPLRRKEMLAERALINNIFGDKVYLGHHENESPFIQNSPIHISISHTSRFVAIITHPTENVGIDIERLNRPFDSVEKKALSPEEIEDLSDDEKERHLQLAIYWCSKEALYKRVGRHNIDFAKQFKIERFSPHEKGELKAIYTDEDGNERFFDLEYQTVDNHMMVWQIG